MTGVTNFARELEAKKLDLLRKLIPDLRAIGLLVNPVNPNTFSEVGQMQFLASAGGWRLEVIPVRTESELEAAFATMARRRVDAFLLTVDAIFADFGKQIAALAVRYALPGVGPLTGGGSVIGYGASNVDAHRQVGVYAGRILKGEKPADLPIQRSTRVELIINLKTARALGISVPRTVLVRADEVIGIVLPFLQRESLLLARLYGPAVRCKRFLRPG